MYNFVARVVKQAKLIQALNNGEIKQLINMTVFDNVGLLILTKTNMNDVAKMLLKNNKTLAEDQQIEKELTQFLQQIKSKVPETVEKFVKSKSIGQIIKLRQGNTNFAAKMDEIAEYVRNQFVNIVNPYSQSFIDEEIKNWNIK